MAESFVYAAILGSIMSTISSLKTHLIIFDTDVVDLTEYLSDPVDLLFRGQLGGGTNIQKAVRYASDLIYSDPSECYLILISDLFEGAPLDLLYDTIREVLNHQVQMFCVLALDDSGVPAFDKSVAKNLANLGVPSFGCTPELFPDVIGTALNNEDLQRFIQ